MNSTAQTSDEIPSSDDGFVPSLPASPLYVPPKPQPPEETEILDKERIRGPFKRKYEDILMSEEDSVAGNDPYIEEREDISLRDSLIENLEPCKEKTNLSADARNEEVPNKRKKNDNSTDEVVAERKVIKMKGKLPKLSLPEGWIALNHNSGGIIYLHRLSRVVTWSRPYHLGKGSARKHSVPIAAIPCLHQMKAFRDEIDERDEQEDSTNNQKNDTESETVLNFLNAAGTTSRCLESAKENHKSTSENDKLVTMDTSTAKPSKNDDSTGDSSMEYRNGSNEESLQNETNGSNCEPQDFDLLSAEEVSKYLSKIWEFQPMSWEQEKNAVVFTKKEEVTEVPSSIHTVPYSVKGLNSKNYTQEYVFNPRGKSSVGILHEYSQRVLKAKPEYITGECDNANTPFTAAVKINGIIYGEGKGVNKKQAKQISAKSTLDILMPGLYSKNISYEISQQELEFFDTIDIEDKNLHDLCIKTGISSPAEILQECLKRNQGVCPSEIFFQIIPGNNQNHSYIMTVGKHSVQGQCKNKKIGKQFGSQGILKKLHPHLSKWGSLLRIYCDRPSNMVKKFRSEENDETSTEMSSESVESVNTDLLSKLKAEMSKLAVKQAKLKESDDKSNRMTPSKQGESLHCMDI